jgi:hypothetical protein
MDEYVVTSRGTDPTVVVDHDVVRPVRYEAIDSKRPVAVLDDRPVSGRTIS